MNKNGPIIIIEDNTADKDLLIEIFESIDKTNEVIFFSESEKALNFLNSSKAKPFLILSDIEMPIMNGFELRKKVQTNSELQIKCIPYLFFTSHADKKSVIDAYSLSVQGFFIKPEQKTELKRTIQLMLDYWSLCISPSQFPD